MTMKSLLLGAAAAIASIGAAQAADLPMSKGEAVEYVKVCSQFGPGFFYIPGTDTCLKISGNFRADYGYNSVPSGRYLSPNGVVAKKDVVDQTGFQGRAQIAFDARTQTDFGLLRSFLLIDAATGNPGAQNWQVGGNWSGSLVYVDKAYLQFGGLTAGYAESQFAFYDNYYGDTIFAPYAGSAGTKEQLAYTAQFGGGFSATLSLEDPAGRRAGVFGVDTTEEDPVFGNLTYAGTQSPDIVANLAYASGDYNKVQLMGALHQSRTLGNNGGADSKWGYALGAAVSWELPVLSGGYFAIEGDYADGATSFTTANFNAYSVVGAPPVVDAYDINGNSTKAKSWALVGETAVNLTPDWQAMLFGSYSHYDAPSQVQALGYGTDFSSYAVGGQLTYTIVKNFTVSGEVSYVRTNAKLPGSNEILASDGTFVSDKSKTGAVIAGIRLRRAF